MNRVLRWVFHQWMAKMFNDFLMLQMLSFDVMDSYFL
jgi:hypothetical protein